MSAEDVSPMKCAALGSVKRKQEVRAGQRSARRGLTMMETSLATLIVGLSVLAVVKLISAVTQQSFYAQKTTTALMLANNIRELMDGLPYNDPAYGTHLGPLTGQTDVSQ